MTPTLGLPPEDEFEDKYLDELRTMLRGHGVLLKHDRDRTGMDIGLHLAKAERVSTSKVWFQIKGKHAATLAVEDFQQSDTVPVKDIRLDHLRFWYASPEPVYLVLYIESAGVFLAEDARDIVDQRWGDAIFSSSTFSPGQETVTVHLRTDAVLNSDRIEQMLAHRSMRIDGPQWRGRPLGHRLDPLRSAMRPLPPPDFRALVERLLEVHGLEVQETLDAGTLLAGISDGSDSASLTRCLMHYTYEWTHPILTEFGYGPGGSFRIEGEPFHVQGPCVVLIHEQVGTLPGTGSGFDDVVARLRNEHRVGWFLVFVNQEESPEHFGTTRAAAEPLQCIPQDLGSLAFNLLTATTVYLEFRDRISWRYVNYLS